MLGGLGTSNLAPVLPGWACSWGLEENRGYQGKGLK